MPSSYRHRTTDLRGRSVGPFGKCSVSVSVASSCQKMREPYATEKSNGSEINCTLWLRRSFQLGKKRLHARRQS
jgi:hypothetical protein